MSVMRFIGINKRDVMRQVRAKLGPDAMILSSRQTEEGIEVMAMADEASQASQDSTTMPVASDAGASNSEAGDFARLAQRLLQEVEQMRSMLKPEQSGAITTVRADMRHDLLRWAQAGGLSGRLTKKALDNVSDLTRSASSILHDYVQSHLRTPEMPVELFAEHGVIALVGPTGVGKTTTTAKLAAHYVMQFGPEGLLLLTTDSYRVGAQEQLKIYAELLGVEMVALGEDDKLEQLAPKLSQKRLVLIDTVGMSQRDQRLTQRIAQLQAKAGAPSATRLVLLLNASSQRETLYEVVERFRAVASESGHEINDCIVTKKDEAASLGAVLDTIIQHDLCVHFVSYGQRVPEDLELADPAELAKYFVQATARIVAENDIFEELWGGSSIATSVAASTSQPAVSSNTRVNPRGLQQLRQRVHQYTPWFQLLEFTQAAVLKSAQTGVGLDLTPIHAQARELLDTQNVAGISWPKSTPVASCKWHLPPMPINNHGYLGYFPIVNDPHQTQGESLDMAAVAKDLHASYHICAALPEPAQRAALNAPWVAVINRNHRVIHAGKAQAALRVNASMTPPQEHRLVYRGEAVRCQLQRADVVLPDTEEPMDLWFGLVEASERKATLVRRHWLSPKGQTRELTEQLLLEQLAIDELASLSRQAVRALQTMVGADAQTPDLVYLGVLIANFVIRVQQDPTENGTQIRHQLFDYSGRRGRHDTTKLLSGVLQMLEASATLAILRHDDAAQANAGVMA
ncbi:flagellar biosynthesis protein FlhF [Aliidiomarina sanyensis]|uniref:Flagellar biosynthesis protein FlhF n=1 Tax=Aliidiomarina sanyensis TaxID=1249555 RepID=A0A432WPT0_9GAMM|nr:flagellar biosynthesis protein FlhF [Aliidiomarina sanyensis]RUO35802.1 flagellar biosynthesis protein FlhF [Aliidiomarina sanyensis]